MLDVITLASVHRWEGVEMLADPASLPEVSDDGAGDDPDQQDPRDAGDSSNVGSDRQAGEDTDREDDERLVRLSTGRES